MRAASFASWTQWLQLAYLANALMVVAIRVAYQRRARRKTTTLSTPSSTDAGLRVIALMSVLALPLVVLLARGFSGADYQLPWFAGAAGIPIILLGTWLFWRAHHDLGLNWSARLRIREDHTLVTEGIYKSIRHPMYAAVLVFGVGQFLLLQNWIAGPMLLVMALVFLVVRVPAEEAMMLRQFGDQYRHYMQQTGRILPKWWNR